MASSGILFPISAIAYSASSEYSISQNSQDLGTATAPSGAWTPPQYSKPAVTIITVPTSGNPVLVSAPVTDSTGIVSAPVYQGGVPAVDYVFDTVLKLQHKRSIEKTSHPVLTGANISDHYYVKPARLVLEIGMSDAMSAYTSGIWVGAATKSVSAYQILKGLELSGTLFTVTTRLDTYYNMMILDLDAPDDHRTSHGLRCSIVLEELISAGVASTVNSSSRAQATGNTNSGTVPVGPINSSQQQQNVLPSTLWPDAPTYPNVPGAGDTSSTSLGTIPPKES